MLMKNNEENQNPNSTMHLLHRAGQCADELFAINIGGLGVTPRQYEVLRAVQACDEPSQTELVKKTGIDRSTLADIVRRLVERGLVERQRTRRDARTYAVKLSDAGKDLLGQVTPAVVTTDDALLAGLDAKDRSLFVRLLRDVVSNIESSAAPAVATQDAH